MLGVVTPKEDYLDEGNISGYKTLYKAKYWGWDGSSREIDLNGDVIESLNVTFIHAFWPETVAKILEVEYGIPIDKVETIEVATDDEIEAWSTGWSNCWENKNDSYK